MSETNTPAAGDADLMSALEDAERAVDAAFSTGKADRAKITRAAQLDAAEAVAMTGIAMESDEAADEAMRLAVIAERTGDRANAREARKRERAARKKARIDHRAATESARRAYDAVRFSAPNKLGFMRAVQVIFALHIAFVLLMLVMTSRDTVSYSSSNVFDWVMIILEGVAFWFFINRYKIARPFVIGMAALEIVVSCGISFAFGTFNIATAIVNSAFSIFLILCFAISRRAKASLVNELSMRAGDYEREMPSIKRLSWPFVRNLVIYFIVFSVLGHWMEMGMCQFIIMGLVEGEYDGSNTMLWRDWLYPYPMEGAAVVLIALLLYPLKEWLVRKIKVPILPYVVSFVANALVCTAIEFFMGLVVNADLQLWDYTNNFGNIMGQVCLQNTLAFGAAASIIAWFVYPLLEKWLARVPRDIMNIVFVVVLVFGGILWSLYIIEPPSDVESTAYTEEASGDDRQADVDAIAAYVAMQESFVDGLQDQIDAATTLTDEERAALASQIEALDASIAEMYETLGVDPSASAPSAEAAGAA